MSFRRWIIAAALGAFSLGVSQTWAENRPVKPVSQWTGSVDNEQLADIAPHVITNAESLGILWKAWLVEGKAPEIDFISSVVVVSTTRGSKLNASFQLEKDGNLKVLEIGTRDLRPGFRYVLSRVSTEDVLTVNNQPLPGHVLEAEPEVVPTSLPYHPGEKLTGTIRLGGSKTMAHLIQLWANSFQEFHPEVKFEIESEGSEAALEELKKDGLAIMGVSHELTPADLKSWEKALGKKIQSFPVCTDHISVIVHPDNPVNELTPAQLKKILAPGAKSLTWGDLGLKGEWADKPVKAHGRDKQSGTRHYLLRLAKLPKDGGESVEEHTSYSEIVDAVAKDPNAIGYAR
ncbi:MAG: substrate-binding domain-containing protein, partial [Planctomycetaceae bacterium]|nr:substrate-binding domain-containing protein [Planctomycetaceae bacterium]